jgi:hypothetical protein
MTAGGAKVGSASSAEVFPEPRWLANIKATGAYSASRSVEERYRSRNLGDATFITTEDSHYYKPIDTYEGIHRWDPDFEWGEAEETRLLRKVTMGLEKWTLRILKFPGRFTRLHLCLSYVLWIAT